MQALIVDGANVVGSRPDGWWRDRAGAARRLQEQLSAAELPHDEVVLVLEGAAKRGNPAGQDGRLRIVHAPGSGDDAIVEAVKAQVDLGDGRGVTVVTSDRELRQRVEAVGAELWAPLGFLINCDSVLESAHSARRTKRFLIVNSSAQIPQTEPETQAGGMFWFRWKRLSGSYRRLMSRSRSRLGP